jgi:predicted naringenin-chalcone synthase
MSAPPLSRPSAWLGDFRIRPTAHGADHRESVEWLSRAHARAEASVRGDDPAFDEEGFRRTMERHILRFGCGPESLARRGHDLADFLHFDWDRMRLFDLGKHPAGAGLEARNEAFAEIADRKVEALFPEGEPPPDDLIHVTCTGYAAPSAVQKLAAARGWHARTGITHAYHMGCYASMPAVRMAAGYLALGARRVDVAHTETCTLHLDPTRHHPEQLVVQSLFADGHIRYSVTAEAPRAPSLAFLGAAEALVPGSLGAMGWMLGDRGMRMILAREVPELVAGALRDFLRGLFASAAVPPAEGLGRGIFAVHPGGPRIIDKVAGLLELSPAQVAASRAVLRDHGNMSSATLPHIWARIAADASVESGSLVTSLAFGPGLTVYGAVLRKG